MRRIKALYSRPPRQVHSHASVELRLPFARLLDLYLPRFLQQTVDLLATGYRVPNVERLLEVEQLRTAWLQWLDADLAGTPPALSFAPRLSRVHDTAAVLNDLASDEGTWTQEIRDSLSAIPDTAQCLVERLHTALRTILEQDGPEAARQLIEFFMDNLAEERETLSPQHERFLRGAWTAGRRADLRATAERLREITANVSWWKRGLHKIAPKLTRSLLLSDIDKYHLRKAIDQANDAYRDRHQAMTHQVRLEVINQLLGKDDQPGLLVREFLRIQQQIAVLQSFAGTAPLPSPASSDPTTIELVNNLDTVIDTQSGLTFGDHWDHCLESAGFNPESFAQRVRSHGLMVNGRRYRVDEWCQIVPEARASAMMAAVRHYFGADEIDRPLRYDDPVFPIDHLAAVKLTDKALRPLINQRVPELNRLIAHFAPNHPIAEADPRQMVFLYCEASQRTAWHEYLGMNTKLTIPEKHGSEPYHLDNPHVLVLINATLGIPGGTLMGYQRWTATGNRARREHPQPPLFPRSDYKETRLIDERDNSSTACEHLFDAGRKCGAIFVVSQSAPERFATSRPDDRVDHLFARQRMAPSWESPEHFHGLLQNGSAFVMFVERQFKLGDFRHFAERLRQEHDAERVAQSLQQLNVIERNRVGQCRILCAHDGLPDGLTEQLYEAQDMQLVGLERHEFTAALQRDHDLHNLLFWSVLDAFQLGELVESDVPASIRDYSASRP